MKPIDLANDLLVKYADGPLEVEEEVPPTRRYPRPEIKPLPETRSKDIVAIEHLISTFHKYELYGRGEAAYLYRLVERGESPKQILSMLKERIAAAQKKLTDCKQELNAWQHLIK